MVNVNCLIPVHEKLSIHNLIMQQRIFASFWGILFFGTGGQVGGAYSDLGARVRQQAIHCPVKSL